MFLTVHASVGLYLGSQISNPWLAFLIGYLSHLILDFIPHGDEKIIDLTKYNETQLKWKFFYAAAIDTFGVVIIFFLLTNKEVIILTPGTLWGMLGSVAPDYLWGIYKITRIVLLKPFHQIHNYFHRLLSSIEIPKYVIIIQPIVFITFILLIINK